MQELFCLPRKFLKYQGHRRPRRSGVETGIDQRGRKNILDGAHTARRFGYDTFLQEVPEKGGAFVVFP